MSGMHAYVQELRQELKDIRRQRDYFARVIEEQGLTIARLQHDRDRAEEIIMENLGETEQEDWDGIENPEPA